MSQFKQGDEVVCIDDSLPVAKEINDKVFQQWIVKDEVYTIRSNSGNQLSLLLKEVKNEPINQPSWGGFAEPRFASSRFIKLDTLEVDLEKEIEEPIKEEL